MSELHVRALAALTLIGVLSGLTSSAAGQQASAGDSLTPLIQTDSAAYGIRRGELRWPDGRLRERWFTATVNLEYHNRTGHMVYFETCHGVTPPKLMRKVHGEWVFVVTGQGWMCRQAPVVIQPGERYAYQFDVHRALPLTDTVPAALTTPLTGTYRVEWDVYRTRGSEEIPKSELGELLPLEQRVSNEFQLVEE